MDLLAFRWILLPFLSSTLSWHVATWNKSYMWLGVLTYSYLFIKDVSLYTHPLTFWTISNYDGALTPLYQFISLHFALPPRRVLIMCSFLLSRLVWCCRDYNISRLHYIVCSWYTWQIITSNDVCLAVIIRRWTVPLQIADQNNKVSQNDRLPSSYSIFFSNFMSLRISVDFISHLQWLTFYNARTIWDCLDVIYLKPVT